MATQRAQQHRGTPPEIPDKLYFKIGDVAKLCEVPAYVLRFWEGEFNQLKPNKSGTGQRLYRKRDVEMALRIKRLLYDEGYTISGARQVFQAETRELRRKNAGPELPLTAIPDSAATAGLEKVRKELREIASLLSAPVGSAVRGKKGRTSPSASAPRTTNLFEM